MVARHLLFTRQDEAVERIAAHAQSIGGTNTDIVDAVERVRNVRGPDEQHIRVFRTEAVADLMQLLDEAITGTETSPLEAKTVPQLRGIAKAEGIEGYSNMNKAALITEIEHNRADVIEYDEQPNETPAFARDLPDYEPGEPGQQPEDGVTPEQADDSDEREAYAENVDEAG